MKKIINILLCTLITLGTIGCTSTSQNVSKDSYTNKIYHAELIEEEKNIIDLIGVESDINIYEYAIDDTYKSIFIWLETYKNGELLSNTKPGFSILSISTGVYSENNLKKGKIAVVVDRTSDYKDYKNYQWRISHQHANGSSYKWTISHPHANHSFTTENDFETNSKFSVGMGGLTEPVEIKPEVEIVLDKCLFLFDDRNSMPMYHNQYYVENPEALKEYDYVYLLKCKFSKKAVREINN